MLDRVPRDAPARRRPQRGPARDRPLRLGRRLSLCLALSSAACLARFEVGETSSDDQDTSTAADASTAGTQTTQTEGEEETCDPACEPTIERCVAGECACRDEFESCEEICVNDQTDPLHCGSCGMSCGAQVCQEGECVDTCEQELVDCDGSCVELEHDPLHCGDCETACAGDELCVEGECWAYTSSDCDTDLDCGAGVCCELEDSETVCLDGAQCP